ncbi:MAG: hypothetical protein EBX51_00090, partial [Acidimicrobiia bacterium]|nr:hypothetical protein [Acidimicrobiia bacterium]
MSTTLQPTTAQTKGDVLVSSTQRTIGILAKRSIRTIRRLPSAFFPALAMPIFNMIVFAGTFFAVTKIPGFPTDRSINWYMPLGIMMGAAHERAHERAEHERESRCRSHAQSVVEA